MCVCVCYVCVYVYVCVCIYVCLYLCVCEYICVCMFMDICMDDVCVHLCMYLCICVCLGFFVGMCVLMLRWRCSLIVHVSGRSAGGCSH